MQVRVRMCEEGGSEGNSSTKERKVVAVAHCILNQSTRWWFKGQTSSLSYGMVKEVVDHLSSLGIGVLQMPCPEFGFYGNPRPSMTKDDYEKASGFKAHCRRVAKGFCNDLEDIKRLGRKPRVKILGILGVEHSPSCAVEEAPRKTNKGIMYRKERGIFMEELEREVRKRDLGIPLIGVNIHSPKDELLRMIKFFKE